MAAARLPAHAGMPRLDAALVAIPDERCRLILEFAYDVGAFACLWVYKRLRLARSVEAAGERPQKQSEIEALQIACAVLIGAS